jgi:hypothetical protein
MRPHRLRTSAPALAAVLVGGALLVPTSPVSAATATEGCTIDDASLAWGFKESFRSYISGSIAKGAWEVADGASYETPSFGFSAGTGSTDADAATGTISFGGSIHFTGHGGLLDTTVANPTIVLTGPGTGQILLDLRSVSMEDAMAGADTEAATLAQVPFGDLDLSGATVARDGESLSIAVEAAPATITAEGFDAFGSYEAGTALDPVSLTASGTCAAPALAEPTPEPTISAPTLEAAAEDEPTSPGLLVAIGGGLVALAGGVTAAVVARRRKSTGA